MIASVKAPSNRLADPLLRAMFAARKRVFVDLLRWDVPVRAGRYEVDQFDTEDAHYLIVTDGAGAHHASARLLPTTRPHILGALFPELCDGAPPADEYVYEITRFCLDRSLTAAARRQARDALVLALVDHARRTGIVGYSAIAELGWFQQILAFGWRCRPLGLPRTVGGSRVAALLIQIDADTPARLASAGVIRPAADRPAALAA